MKSYLADVNVWIALVYDRHAHHAIVQRWFDHLPDESALFCRLTQLGLLRLLTNRQVMGRDAVSQREAWKIYDQVLMDSRAAFLAEPSNTEAAFRRLTQSSEAANQLWSDAYLAALASAAGLTIATLDRGFKALHSDVLILRT